MIEQDALRREVTRLADEQAELEDKQREDRRRRKPLVKAIRAEVCRAVERQQAAGWPNAEPAVVLGVKRGWHIHLSNVQRNLTLVYGEPVSLPLKHLCAYGYSVWLGDDGNLYELNMWLWLELRPDTPLFRLANPDELKSLSSRALEKLLQSLTEL